MKKGITILEEVNMVNADDTLPAGALPEEAVYPIRAASGPNHRVHSHTQRQQLQAVEPWNTVRKWHKDAAGSGTDATRRL